MHGRLSITRLRSLPTWALTRDIIKYHNNIRMEAATLTGSYMRVYPEVGTCPGHYGITPTISAHLDRSEA